MSATDRDALLIPQAQFARLRGVSRKTVSVWKAQGRLVMIGDRVDVVATESISQATASGRSRIHAEPLPKRDKGNNTGAPGNNAPAVSVTHAAESNTLSNHWPPGVAIAAGTGLPSVACDAADAIATGAADMVVILLRRSMPLSAVQEAAGAWVATSRIGACGCLDNDLGPAPGFNSWRDHPLFALPWPQPSDTSWDDLVSEATEHA